VGADLRPDNYKPAETTGPARYLRHPSLDAHSVLVARVHPFIHRCYCLYSNLLCRMSLSNVVRIMKLRCRTTWLHELGREVVGKLQVLFNIEARSQAFQRIRDMPKKVDSGLLDRKELRSRRVSQPAAHVDRDEDFVNI
jgi:hypothetical protein